MKKKTKPAKRPARYLEVMGRFAFGGDWVPLFWVPLQSRNSKGRFEDRPVEEATALCVEWIREQREGRGRQGVEYRIQNQDREIIP